MRGGRKHRIVFRLFPTLRFDPNLKHDFCNGRMSLQVMMGNEFHFLFFAMIFLSAPPCVLVLAVLGRRSLWSVCTYAEKNRAENALWKKFAPIWAKLKVQESQLEELGKGAAN